MILENYAQKQMMEDGNLNYNELCTLEMEWLPSLPNFVNLLLHNGYGTIIEPIFKEDGKIDNNKLLLTIMDK